MQNKTQTCALDRCKKCAKRTRFVPPSRGAACSRGSGNCIKNRWGWTTRYPAIVAAALRLPAQHFVLDGEGIVEAEGGIGDFKLLHSRKHDRRCQLIAFDITRLGALDLTSMPLEMRKRLLAELLEGSAGGIVYAEHFGGDDGAAVFDAACKMGLEGIVSKRKDRPYCPGPCKHWVKVKNPDGAWRKRLENQ